MPKVLKNSGAVIPIRWFRGPSPRAGLIGQSPDRVFLSSGTTSGSSDQRSRSQFSREGLSAYRAAAMAGFRFMLGQMMPHIPEIQKVHGYSLIPDNKGWPHSSLSQMLTWIAEEFSVTWLDGDNLTTLDVQGENSVFIFGTAFHFVNLADDSFRCKLPRGSIVIETGGTKGRSRSVSRDELHHLIGTCFTVSHRQIVSEYGMAELASQAWDFIPPDGPPIAAGDRVFRFPPTCLPSVTVNPNVQKTEGVGLLTVEDKARIDFELPIQTEDVAELRADGRFKLLGRAMATPLKGCSTLVERALPARESARRYAASPWIWDDKVAEKTAAILMEQIREHLGSAQSLRNLSEDLSNRADAAFLIKTLYASLPQTIDDWMKAAKVATQVNHEKNWLIIGPSSHPLAPLQPLMLGLTAGLSLTLRTDPKNSSWIIEFLIPLLRQAAPGRLHLAGPSLRLSSDEPNQSFSGGVLIFGEDQTIANVAKAHVGPVAGFGSALAVAVVDAELLGRPEILTQLTWDAFSLGQRGCMNVRAVFVDGDYNLKPEAFDAAFEQCLGRLRSELTRAGLVLEASRQLELGRWVHLGHGALITRCDETVPLTELLPATAFALTFARDTLLTDFMKRSEIRLLVAPGGSRSWLKCQKLVQTSSHDVQLRPLGLAQAPPWSGLHEGRPWFHSSSIKALSMIPNS